MVSLLRETLGIPTVLIGFALPDDRMHAPNEKFHLPNFYRGIMTSVWFLHELGAMSRASLAFGNASIPTSQVELQPL